MAKHIQTIRRQIADKLFVFGHFVGLAFKGLRRSSLLYSLNFTCNSPISMKESCDCSLAERHFFKNKKSQIFSCQ